MEEEGGGGEEEGQSHGSRVCWEEVVVRCQRCRGQCPHISPYIRTEDL